VESGEKREFKLRYIINHFRVPELLHRKYVEGIREGRVYVIFFVEKYLKKIHALCTSTVFESS
jgi:hypothetical protein